MAPQTGPWSNKNLKKKKKKKLPSSSLVEKCFSCEQGVNSAQLCQWGSLVEMGLGSLVEMERVFLCQSDACEIRAF